MNTAKTIEPVGVVGRCPEGTSSRPTEAVMAPSTLTPASSWILPARTTLMGPGGHHRKYWVSVNIRTLSELNTQSRRPSDWIRSRRLLGWFRVYRLWSQPLKQSRLLIQPGPPQIAGDLGSEWDSESSGGWYSEQGGSGSLVRSGPSCCRGTGTQDLARCGKLYHVGGLRLGPEPLSLLVLACPRCFL